MKRVRYKKQSAPEVLKKHFGRGNPCYRDHYAREAEFLCRRGATFADLADVFDVSPNTIHNWLSKHPAFGEAVNKGKAEEFDPKIERALAERALGYSVDTTELFVIDGEIVEHPVRKHYPPDVTSMIFWLKNRMPERYRDVYKHDVNARVLRSPEEIRLELLRELKDASDKGLLSLPAPPKK